MPIPMEEIDEMDERQSILDKMEAGMFYSFQEIAELILGKKHPYTKDEIHKFLVKGGTSRASTLASMSFWTQDQSYIWSVINTRLIRKELILGYKNNRTYFAKKG